MTDNLFDRLADLFRSSGPVNWRLAREIAESAAGPAEAIDPWLDEEYRDLAATAVRYVDAASPLDPLPVVTVQLPIYNEMYVAERLIALGLPTPKKRLNVNVAVQYVESWLRGVGAAAIYNLMEDTATAEISRAQVWQWINHPTAALPDGRKVAAELVRSMLPEEMEKIRSLYGDELFAAGKFQLAGEIFERLVTAKDFVEFLTLIAYDYLD